MKERLRPESITDIQIHRNTNPAVVTVFRGPDQRILDVHKPFKFSVFGITELDELRPIIDKKQNVVVPELLKSLKLRYDRLKKIPEVLDIPSLLPASSTQAAPTKISKRKRNLVQMESEIKVPGLDCDRSLPKGINFINNVILEEPERGLCFTDEYGNPTFQRWSDIDRPGIKAMLRYLMMVSPIKSAENVRFCLDLKVIIEEHPDKHVLRSKRSKLEAIGYKLDI